MDKLHTLYADYAQAAESARQKAGILANLLGSAGSGQRHPCHEAFYRDVERWVTEFIEGEPAEAQAVEVGQFLLAEPAKHRKEAGYWFMFAAVGLMGRFLPLLGPESCEGLARQMGSLYPKRERLPVQEQLLRSLCQKAGLDSKKAR